MDILPIFVVVCDNTTALSFHRQSNSKTIFDFTISQANIHVFMFFFFLKIKMTYAFPE